MKYIRNQIVVKTIFNDDIKDKNSIIKLIENLIEISIDIHIEYKNIKLDIIKSHDRVRILSIKDNKIKIRVFVGNSMHIVNGIDIDDILCIKVTTGRQIISLDEETSVGKFIDFT